MTIFQILAASLIAYLIGSFPTGVIATKIVGAPDVRYHGSGNTGGTNTMKLTTPRIGAVVAIIDGLKGLLAWALAYVILAGSLWTLPIAGFMATVGHCWPIYTKFHGGMGLATAGGLIFIFTPITFAFIIPIWALLFFIFFNRAYSPRAVALSAIIGAALQIIILFPEFHIRWFLVFVMPILFIKHLSEWNRQH